MTDQERTDHPVDFIMPARPPVLGPDKTVFWLAGAADGPAPSREFEDILLRKVPTSVAARFRAAAGARGMTHAQFLAGLIALHERMRTRADEGLETISEDLKSLGLQTVSL